jgi:tetratricopeptide (TPR) repeat protein
MVSMAFKKIFAGLIDVLFRRVISLFLIAGVLWFVILDQNALKVKTLNYLLPSAEDIRELADHPSGLNREKLTNLLIYYKTVCEFVTNDPEEPAPCAIVGYAYYYLGNEKKAIQYYQRAAKLNDRFFWFHYNLGVIYYNQERYSEAGECFARALSVPRDHAKYFFMLTKTYREISRLLDLTEDDYEENLKKGYDLVKKLYMISQLLVEEPEMREHMERQKIDMHLF